MIMQVFWDTELFKTVEFYMGDVLEMASQSLGTLIGETAQLLLRSSETKLHELVAFYFKDSLCNGVHFEGS